MQGSSDDPTRYRCIGLLNSAYKVLSAVMLNRITDETTGYLQDWQAGFRQNRGCRDNVMILRTAINKRLKEGKPMILTFIDYSAAFDSVGHKFLDEALAEARAKPKTRAIFRSIYGSATARTRVKGTDGEDVLSDKFPIRRGVIQGDLTSPIYFIIALEAILRRHDKVTGKGIDFGGVRLHTLGYADDAALIDDCPHRSSERVTRIARGSNMDADMQINISKTECMHVKRQQRVHTPNTAEAKQVCKFVCKNVGCGWVFGNKHGLKIHQSKWCKFANYYRVEKLLDVAASELPIGIGPAKFLVKWEGYGHGDNTWEPYENITKAAINEYLQSNGKYDHQWQHRCPRCDKPCRSARGVKVHYARKCKKYEREQQFEGTIAKKKHVEAVLTERQKLEVKVICEGKPLKNCFLFKYLGSMFAADGSEDADLKRRIGMATTRCGQLRFVLGASNIKMATKLKIYKCAVGSLFTYGSEAWNLSESTLRKLNGANAGCLHRFTGKTRVEESRKASCTYSLTEDIRRRRAIWLGHILRMDDSRLVRIAARMQYDMQEGGNLFLDSPDHSDYDDLVIQANDRQAWRQHVQRRFGTQPKRKRKHKKKNKSQLNFLSALANQRHNPADRGTSGSSEAARPNATQLKPATWHTLIPPSSKVMRANSMAQTQLSAAWCPQHQSKLAKKGTKQKTKKKAKGLTDGQRAAWAHAHYIINHGSADDAARFLTFPKNVNRTPPEALHQIRVMARRRVPTWGQAKDAIFSSSESSMESLATHTRLCTSIIPRRVDEPSDTDLHKTKDESAYDCVSLSNPSSPTTESSIGSSIPPSPEAKMLDTPTTSTATSSQTTRKAISPPIRHRTRSKTAQARRQAAEAKAATAAPSPPPAVKSRPRRKRGVPKPSVRPMKVKIAPSQIPGAGMGLYLMEDAEKGDWIARYSGDPLTKAECDNRPHSHYRMQVHKNLFLDAANAKHFEGRFINDARRSKFKTNARFAANYSVNICSTTGFFWVRIYASRKIKAGDEVFIDYGEDFWAFLAQLEQFRTASLIKATTISTVTSQWALPAPFPDSTQEPTMSVQWAAPAPSPELSSTTSRYQHHHNHDDTHSTTTTHSNTLIWPPQIPAPSSPTILGHINPPLSKDQPSTHFNIPLSPIAIGPSPNHNLYMNETYSYTQMYNMDDTLLLPYNITNPNTQHMNVHTITHHTHT